MTFTFPELREELQTLGYGGVPDHVIVASLSQLKLDLPQSWNDEKVWQDWSSCRQGARAGKTSSRRVHGSPVPGDREFATTSKKSTVIRGGLDAVCFTPDFATELDEMRKMFRIMEGRKEELFGKVATKSSISTGKRMGLADEHEQYVGSLMDQWRLVGRTLRSKRKGKGHPAGTGDTSERYNTASNSGTCEVENRDTGLGTQLPPPAEMSRELEAWGDSDGSWTGKLERVEVSKPLEHCLLEKVERESRDDGMARVGMDSTANSNEADSISTANSKEGYPGSTANLKEGGDTSSTGHSEEGDPSAAQNRNVTDFYDSKSGKAVEENVEGPVFTSRESPSAISPGASYQQGGMLYQEIFIDRYNHSDDRQHNANGDAPRPSHQDPEDSPSPEVSPPFSARKTKSVLDKLSALSNDQFLAAFEKSLEGLDPQDTIDQETFAIVNRKITRSHVNLRSHHAARPVESENPFSMSSIPVLRTPDRRVVGSGHQSPLNDRSNIRIAEDTVPPHASSAKPVFKTTELKSTTVTPKRNSAGTLKRSRSSRDQRGIEKVEAHGIYVSDITENRLDPRLSLKASTPPRSGGRKLKSGKILRHSQSEKNSPSIPVRNDGVVRDPYQLDITSLSLSPIKVREPASPFKLSSRERSCVVTGLPEHRPGTCTVCPPSSVRQSCDSSSSHSRSPFGKHVERVSIDSDASPKKKPASKKEIGASPKQKLPLRKGLGPSGIYTPLLDPKKNDVNSKVLLKTARLASTTDPASQISRRTPTFLRSNTESSRSSVPQRTPSSQRCKSSKF